MKRLMLLIGSVFILAQADAQVLNRSFFVTANGGATLQKESADKKAKSLQFGGSINYQLNNRWSLGLATEHAISTAESINNSVVTSGSGYNSYYSYYETEYKSWFIGPQARYYYPLSQKISLFGEAQAGLYRESLESESTTSSFSYPGGNNGSNDYPAFTSFSSNKAKATAARAIVSPGVVYYVKPRFGIELKTNVMQYYHGFGDNKLPEGEELPKRLNLDFSLANSRFGASFYF